MDRFPRSIVLFGFLSGTLLGQEPTALEEAIAHLADEALDPDQLIVVIDAGAEAVDPLVEALDRALLAGRATEASRITRALRAIGEPAATRSERLLAMLSRNLTADASAWNEGYEGLARTIAELAWLDPAGLPKLRSAATDLFHPVVLAGVIAKKVGNRQTSYCRVLGRIALNTDEGDPTSPDLSLDGEDFVLCEFAAERAATHGRAALPEVLQLLHRTDPPIGCRVRLEHVGFATRLQPDEAHRLIEAAAARSLARIAPEHPESALGLALLATDAPDPRERVRAMRSLGALGDVVAGNERLLALLLEALGNDANRPLLADAITACGTIGASSAAFRERLKTLSEDERPEIAARANSALRSIERR